MTTYTVTKTVEYLYTIEAKSEEDARLFAFVRSEDEAFQSTLIDIIAESDEEYQLSIESV